MMDVVHHRKRARSTGKKAIKWPCAAVQATCSDRASGQGAIKRCILVRQENCGTTPRDADRTLSRQVSQHWDIRSVAATGRRIVQAIY
jgi:hypothetical protein